MGQLVFQATLGGQVNLVGPNTASTFNINVPAVAGNMVTTGDTGTVTSTMLASSLSLTTPNINVATGTSLKVSAGFYSTSSSSFTYTDGIVVDYTTGTGRISVGGSDGLTIYNGGVAATALVSVDSSSNFKFNSGYGSVATAYGCRAWVNFNSSASSGVIRASGNVSSVTWNATGDYTVNFTTALPDANYSSFASASPEYGVTPGGLIEMNSGVSGLSQQNPTTSGFRFAVIRPSGTGHNSTYVNACVFR